MGKPRQLPDEYDGQIDALRTGFTPGEKVKGTVTAITRNTVFIEISAKSEGIIERQDLLDENGELTVKVGDTILAYFTGYDDGEFRFTVRMHGQDADAQALQNAVDAQIPVEGRVVAERKGGFEVKVGNVSGFCPFSQMDLYGARDPGLYIGNTFTFRILEYDERNLVLSRRAHLEEERLELREQLKQGLREGDTISGTITKVLDFGAFVDIGGVEGLIPASELSWDRSQRPDEVVKPGERVEVVVQKLDWEKERFTLSRRRAAGDPWAGVEQKFHATKQYHGVVTKLMPFGAFVQLEPGVEGLVHISKLGAGKRLNHASEVLQEGQQLDVYIDNIDTERQRISLVLENPQVGRAIDVGQEGVRLTVGEEVEGRVEEIKQFGVFVKLSPTQTGLLHVSEIPFDGMVNKGRDMYKRFPPGSTVTVVVNAIHGDRISLGLPSSGDDSAEYRNELQDEGRQPNLGDLGSLFDGLKL